MRKQKQSKIEPIVKPPFPDVPYRDGMIVTLNSTELGDYKATVHSRDCKSGEWYYNIVIDDGILEYPFYMSVPITKVKHAEFTDDIKFKDIPQYTRMGNYEVDIMWSYLDHHLERHIYDYHLNLNPDFQRAHVWSQDKQIKYVEYILKGGKASRTIYTNQPNWHSGSMDGPYELIDGKQRLKAALNFIHNKIPVFGHYYRQFSDPHALNGVSFRWNVNDLKTRAEVLQFYLDLNSGGVVHTEEELDKVRRLLEEEKLKE